MVYNWFSVFQIFLHKVSSRERTSYTPALIPRFHFTCFVACINYDHPEFHLIFAIPGQAFCPTVAFTYLFTSLCSISSNIAFFQLLIRFLNAFHFKRPSTDALGIYYNDDIDDINVYIHFYNRIQGILCIAKVNDVVLFSAFR